MNKIKTTVVILNYNGENYLGQLLLALNREDCRVLIADNKSIDSSKFIFDNLELPDNKFQWLQFDKNHGFAKGNNLAAEYVSTETILFMNNDMLPKKHFIKILEQRIKSCHIVGCRLIFGKTKTHKVQCETGEFDFKTKVGLIQHAGIGFYKKGMPYEMGRDKDVKDKAFNKPKEVNAVTGAALMIRKADFERLGGFPEEYVNGWEDTSLCLKAKEHKMCIYYEPRAEIIHFCSSSKGRFDNEIKNKNKFKETWIDSGRIFKII